MNLLTINSFDCSADAAGGVNRITELLSRQFTDRGGINCYLGFFEKIPEQFSPAPFCGRIQLNRHFNTSEFRDFLLYNKIDIVQVNFLKKQNLPVIKDIYQISHQCGAKVIYAFHMCPGFQTVIYGSWEMVKYCIIRNDNILPELKKWLLTISRPVARLFEPMILRNKYRIPMRNCDKLVVLSEQYIAPYLRLAGVRQADKMIAIPNALRFTHTATKKDIENKQHTVLTVARFDEDTKRISLILKVWRKVENNPLMDDWKLQLVGTGRDIDFYRHLVKKWNLKRVEFTGHQNPQEYYRKASVFLMTSSAEGWGMTITEALQMGCPVIAFNSFGSLADQITDGGNGFLIRDGNLDDFYGALLKLINDENLRYQLAMESVQRSHRFLLNNITDKWHSLFNSLTSTRNNINH